MQKTSVFADFYCLPNKLALMGLHPGPSSARAVQISDSVDVVALISKEKVLLRAALLNGIGIG